jgi:hypothetical protein
MTTRESRRNRNADSSKHWEDQIKKVKESSVRKTVRHGGQFAQCLVTAQVVKTVYDVKSVADYDGRYGEQIPVKVKPEDIFLAVCGDPTRCTGANAIKRTLVELGMPVLAVVFGRRPVWVLHPDMSVTRFEHAQGGNLVNSFNDGGEMNKTIGLTFVLVTTRPSRQIGARKNEWDIRPSSNYQKRQYKAAVISAAARMRGAFAAISRKAPAAG